MVLDIMHDAWRTTPGVAFPKDGAEGKAGVVWIPRSVDPRNETRSFARTAHYEPVKSRSNYAILTGHKVVKIGFSSVGMPLTAESVSITPRSGDEPARTVPANIEIIPRSLLQQANITVVHHLPGVGQNFHDHSYLGMQYNCEFHSDNAKNCSLTAQTPPILSLTLMLCH
jgi:choline dehydrogenase